MVDTRRIPGANDQRYMKGGHDLSRSPLGVFEKSRGGYCFPEQVGVPFDVGRNDRPEL